MIFNILDKDDNDKIIGTFICNIDPLEIEKELVIYTEENPELYNVEDFIEYLGHKGYQIESVETFNLYM